MHRQSLCSHFLYVIKPMALESLTDKGKHAISLHHTACIEAAKLVFSPHLGLFITSFLDFFFCFFPPLSLSSLRSVCQKTGCCKVSHTADCRIDLVSKKKKDPHLSSSAAFFLFLLLFMSRPLYSSLFTPPLGSFNIMHVCTCTYTHPCMFCPIKLIPWHRHA